MSSQVETIARAGERPSDADIQNALAQAVRGYAERAAETDNALSAFPPAAQMTATEVMVTVTAMLKAVNLQVFELGMWQAWSGK
jgi:Ser/Thr protein kinase RdoA (MazF antagonist)